MCIRDRQFRDLATCINIFANAPFTFLPVLIGFSATKRFGGNPYLGAAMGMIMVHPDLLNAYSLGTGVEVPTWNLFGLSVQAVGYQGTVLPVLAVSWILANLEKRLHKVTPKMCIRDRDEPAVFSARFQTKKHGS